MTNTTLARRPRTQRTARVREVRVSVSTMAALKRKADAAGVTTSEALWQILTAYAAAPWKLDGEEGKGKKDGRWPSVMVEPEVLAMLQAQARKAKLPQGQAVRTIVQKWLAAA